MKSFVKTVTAFLCVLCLVLPCACSKQVVTSEDLSSTTATEEVDDNTSVVSEKTSKKKNKSSKSTKDKSSKKTKSNISPDDEDEKPESRNSSKSTSKSKNESSGKTVYTSIAKLASANPEVGEKVTLDVSKGICGSYVIKTGKYKDNGYSILELFNGKYAVRVFDEQNTFTKAVPSKSLVAHKGFNGFLDFITLDNGQSTYGAYPQNTVQSVEHAVRLGYKMVEIDIQVTKDGKWIVCHDDTTKTLGDGDGRKIIDCTYNEIKNLPVSREWIGGGYGDFSSKLNKEYVPTLDAVLRTLYDTDTIVILDTKWIDGHTYTDEEMDTLASVIRSNEMQERCAVYGASLTPIAKRIPEIIVAYTSIPTKENWEEFFGILSTHKNYMMSLSSKEYTKALDFCKKYSVPLAVWIADDYRKVEKLFKDGVDYVLTDGCLLSPNLSSYQSVGTVAVSDGGTTGSGTKTVGKDSASISSSGQYTVNIPISFGSLKLLPGDIIKFSAKCTKKADDAFLKICTVGAPILRNMEISTDFSSTLYYTVNDNYPYDLIACLGVKNGSADFSNIKIEILRQNIR